MRHLIKSITLGQLTLNEFLFYPDKCDQSKASSDEGDQGGGRPPRELVTSERQAEDETGGSDDKNNAADPVDSLQLFLERSLRDLEIHEEEDENDGETRDWHCRGGGWSVKPLLSDNMESQPRCALTHGSGRIAISS